MLNAPEEDPYQVPLSRSDLPSGAQWDELWASEDVRPGETTWETLPGELGAAWARLAVVLAHCSEG